MNLRSTRLFESFMAKKVMKIIIGIDNVSLLQIFRMAKIAEVSGSTYIDITANVNAIKFLRSFSPLPVCVSSINPIELYNSVTAGADMIELGNFDHFYEQGIYIGGAEILSLANEVKSLVNGVHMCVTIPNYISFNQQLELAQNLEAISIDVVQTESFSIRSRLVPPQLINNNLFSTIYPSCVSFLSTYVIANSVNIPVITSSSVNYVSIYIPFLCGACGVGVGSAVSTGQNILEMYKYARLLSSSIFYAPVQSDVNRLYESELPSFFPLINKSSIIRSS